MSDTSTKPGWKILPTYDAEEGLIDINNDIHVKVDATDDGTIAKGSGIMLVKTEEVWSTCPETGQSDYLLDQRTYIKRLDKEDSDLMLAKLEADGIALGILRGYFN